MSHIVYKHIECSINTALCRHKFMNFGIKWKANYIFKFECEPNIKFGIYYFGCELRVTLALDRNTGD